MSPYFLQDPNAYLALYAVFAIWVVPEFIGSVTQLSGPDAQKHDRGSSLILYAMVSLGMTAAFFGAFRFQSLAMFGPRAIIFWVGLALILSGVALRWYAIHVLGEFFTRDVAVRPEQGVVRAGPYRYIRHPSYSGSLLSFLGAGLALGNWASLAAIMLCVMSGYTYRVYVEERALMHALGQPYVDYMRRTRRFIPFVL